MPCAFPQTRWLAGHSASFAAGLALEALAQRLQPAAVRRAAAGGAVGAMRSAGGALPLLLGSTAVLLQAAGELLVAAGELHGTGLSVCVKRRCTANLWPRLTVACLLPTVSPAAPGLQHLHPFLSLVRGYHRGLGRAFKWTASLLGAGGAAHLASLAQLLPVLAHGLFRALA